jgi:putative transcription factor
MNTKRTSDIDRECPICGSLIWGKGVKVLIEGAKITVCQACAEHGMQIIKRQQTQPKRSKPKIQSSSSLPRYRNEINEDLEIVEDYDKRIRKVRQRLKLNQDQFANKLNEKPSLLRRIESRKAKPTINLARKIEKVYEITLIKTSESIDSSPQLNEYMKKRTGSSLGDIAFIKKKK